MTAPTRVDELTVVRHDDTTDRFTRVGFYRHRDGLDVVDQAGQYLARYDPEDFLTYQAFTAQTITAAQATQGKRTP